MMDNIKVKLYSWWNIFAKYPAVKIIIIAVGLLLYNIIGIWFLHHALDIDFAKYQLTFDEPMSVYAHGMVLFHNRIMCILSIILVVVYWCLYKIIKDYSWSGYSNTMTLRTLLVNLYEQHIPLNANSNYKLDVIGIVDRMEAKYLLYIYNIYIYLLLSIDFVIGKISFSRINTMEYNLYMYYLTSIKVIFGHSYRFSHYLNKNEYNNYVGINGQWLFNAESKWFMSRDADSSNLQSRIYHMLIADLGSTSSFKQIMGLVAMKSIDQVCYNYKSESFFNNGRVKIKPFSRRRAHYLNNPNDYGAFTVFKLAEEDHLVDNLLVQKRVNAIMRRVRPNTMSNAFRGNILGTRRFRHYKYLEWTWALFPISIIYIILVPSLYLLYSMDDELDPGLNIKIIGNQWYWSYEFNNWVEISPSAFEYSEFTFESYIVQTNDLEFGTKRLLEVDKRLVLPMNTIVRVTVGSGDVIHAWAVPQLGVKVDAVPGRLNQFLIYAQSPGVYYGQCSELCGVAHGFMPIVVHVVPYENYITWLRESGLLSQA